MNTVAIISRATRFAAAAAGAPLATALLAALAACGGGDTSDTPTVGFEPITCSASPSACA